MLVVLNALPVMRGTHMTDGRSNPRARRKRRWRRDPTQVPQQHGLDLVDYLDELAEVRAESRKNLASAGDRALKVLDRFLSNLANALGMDNDRAGMGDSIHYLNRLQGVPHDIAVQAERFRDTRNALAHNPDVMLRPEAAMRVIDGVEGIVRMASERVDDLAHRRIVTTTPNEPLTAARDRMIDHHYAQLVVVDDKGKVLDLLTDRDIVVAEAKGDIDNGDSDVTVGAAVAERGYSAAKLLARTSSADEAVEALRDERVAAVVITENGKTGEAPLGIVTRGDVLKSQ
jgi:CBS domain-containing protein